MARLALLLSAFLLVQVSSAALSPSSYWKHVMPDTRMPDVVRAFLYPDLVEKQATEVGAEGKEVVVNAPGTHVIVGRPGVRVHAPGTYVNVGHGVGVYSGHGRKPVVVRAPYGPFLYNYAASEDQLKYDPNVALFFLEKDLHQGKKMNLQFVRTDGAGPAFVPRAVADATPFSTAKFPDILHRFSLSPNSKEASLMKRTLQECEEPANKGETRYCATSLESMIDFSVSQLGTRHLQVLATEVEKGDNPQKRRTYSVLGGVELVATPTSVVCHNQPYPYAVFYCHKTTASRAYVVPLGADDGSKVNAVAVCHLDTSTWNPKHLAFRVLGVKPGSVPVCHFLPQDHLVWAPVN
ncbi:BURP domain protein [Nymphaea thermarum]|nr:BURP domain protein [Nymphaea thermarum]